MGEPYTVEDAEIDGIIYHARHYNSDPLPEFTFEHWEEERTISYPDGTVMTFVRDVDCYLDVVATSENQGTKPTHMVPLQVEAVNYVYDSILGYWHEDGYIPNNCISLGGWFVDCNGKRVRIITVNSGPREVTPQAQ